MTSNLRARNRVRTSTRPGLRHSRCHRHLDEPVTGICASCLRERLSGLDAADTVHPSSPELRRSRSVVPSGLKLQAYSPRRRSCDVVLTRDYGNANSLVNHFDVDDLKSGSDGGVRVESKNLGLSRVSYTVIESNEEGIDFDADTSENEVRVSGSRLGEVNEQEEEEEEGEFKTMKEYIDLEFMNKSKKKSKDLRGIAGNLWGAASVFSKTLKKWKMKKNEDKKVSDNCTNEKEKKNVTGAIDGDEKLFKDFERSEISGRRSCDVERRFSVDGGRISFEEPRASWDGYMIARTIPRLAPMFSVVENGILGGISGIENSRLSVDGPMMLSIIEDETSSGASGSGHSNSDSSSSMRASSFDRSSSVRSFGKKGTGLGDRGTSPANSKLVITEKELKDWRMGSTTVDDGLKIVGSLPRNTASAECTINNTNAASAKKSVKWRKVCTAFGLKPKNSENTCETTTSNVLGTSVDYNPFEKQLQKDGGHKRDVTDLKLTRSSSIVASRDSCDFVRSNYGRRSVDSAVGFGFKGTRDFELESNGSDRCTMADAEDDGITPFYMTPLRSLRSSSKLGKFKLQNPYVVADNVFQLN